jgi:hypothetical protein
MAPGPRPRTIRSRFALHLSVLVVGAAVLRVAAVPAEVCPPVTATQVRVAVDETLAWFERNLGPDGRYAYAYDMERDVIDPTYNDARHAGVMMSLYQTYAALGEPRARRIADAGLRYVLDSILVEEGWSAWHRGGDVEVGPNGLLLAGLAIRRLATGDPSHDVLMADIGRFLLGQQQPDGSVHARWSPATRASVPVTAIFPTGQASWAWALLEQIFPGEGWGEAAALTLHYLATERDRAEGEIARYPDHWAAYTLGDLPARFRTDVHRDHARRLAGFFGIRIRMESQRTGEGLNLYLRWYPGPPAGVGTAMEGIGALHAMSRTEPRLADLRANIEDRMVCAAGMMVDRQETAESAAGAAEPGLVRGAWFYRGRTQMDDQQHVLSGLVMVIPVLEEREEAGG